MVKSLLLKDGVLHRKWFHDNGDKYWLQMVIPRKMRDIILEQCHDHILAGHRGVTTTLHKVRLRFFFPKMKEFVQHWVTSCSICQARKSPKRPAKAPLQSYLNGAPFEKVALDITGPYCTCDEGYTWIVSFICTFSRYAVAVPIKTLTAAEICDKFIEHWIVYFGLPLELHADRATSFESNLWAEMCKMLGINKSRSCVMHPLGNGTTERLQQSLVTMLNCVCVSNPFSWSKLIRLVALAYNNTRHESTKMEPSR